MHTQAVTGIPDVRGCLRESLYVTGKFMYKVPSAS